MNGLEHLRSDSINFNVLIFPYWKYIKLYFIKLGGDLFHNCLFLHILFWGMK